MLSFSEPAERASWASWAPVRQRARPQPRRPLISSATMASASKPPKPPWPANRSAKCFCLDSLYLQSAEFGALVVVDGGGPFVVAARLLALPRDVGGRANESRNGFRRECSSRSQLPPILLFLRAGKSRRRRHKRGRFTRIGAPTRQQLREAGGSKVCSPTMLWLGELARARRGRICPSSSPSTTTKTTKRRPSSAARTCSKTPLTTTAEAHLADNKQQVVL